MSSHPTNVAAPGQDASEAAADAPAEGIAEVCARVLDGGWAAVDRLLHGDLQGASAAMGPSLTSCYNAVAASLDALSRMLGIAG